MSISQRETAPSVVHGLSLMFGECGMLTSLYKTMEEFPDANWTDAFSVGQIQSKLWMVEALRSVVKEMSTDGDLGVIYICGSWYGILGDLLLSEYIHPITRIRGFDIDENAVVVANRLNRHWNDGWMFKTSHMDIHDLNFYSDRIMIRRFDGEMTENHDTPDTIINTSCEHIERFPEWYSKIPAGKLVVMQGNDFYDGDGHINCSANLQVFSDMTPMTEVLYSGELELEKYTRFMRIGYR